MNASGGDFHACNYSYLRLLASSIHWWCDIVYWFVLLLYLFSVVSLNFSSFVSSLMKDLLFNLEDFAEVIRHPLTPPSYSPRYQVNFQAGKVQIVDKLRLESLRL